MLSALILAFVALGTAAGNAATVENDAVVGDGINQEAIDAAVALILLNGYKCDSVSAIRKFFIGRGFVVKCNRYAYTYEIEDRGGNWVVCWEEC